MSRVVRQGPCPRCPSSDAYTVYDDGHAYCFSCGKHFPGKWKPIVEQVETKVIYSDLTDLTPECFAVLAKYHISHAGYYFRYSPSHNRLVMVLDDFKTGRALDSREPKWLSEGEKPWHIFGDDYANHVLAIVEDPFSALCVTRFVPTFCLFGTKMPLGALKWACRRKKHVIVWLDYDANDKAQEIARKARLMGMSASVFRTELDPKDMELDNIKQLVGITKTT